MGVVDIRWIFLLDFRDWVGYFELGKVMVF